MSQAADSHGDVLAHADIPAHVLDSFRNKAVPDGLKDYEVIREIDDFRWFTPLIEAERRAVERLLIRQPECESVSEDSDSVLVGLTALRNCDLVRLAIKVYTKSTRREESRESKQFSGASDQHEKGEIEEVECEKLLTGLPFNRLSDSSSIAARLSEHEETLEEWVDIDIPTERKHIIADVNAQVCPPVEPRAVVSLKRKALPFYTPADATPGDRYRTPGIYRMEVRARDSNKLAFFVWQPGAVEVLDWTSRPIYRLNARFANTLRRRLNSDMANVRDYLRFFCDFVAGDDGPFTIIEDMEHPRFEGVNIDEQERETVAGKAVPMTKSRVVDGDYIVSDVLIWYGSAMFVAEFKVSAEGRPEMLGDEPIAITAEGGSTYWSEQRERPLKISVHPFVSRIDESNRAQKKLVTVHSAHASAADSVEKRPDPYANIAPPIGIHTVDTVEDAIIVGDVDWSNQRLEKNREFHRCRFRGDVDLSEARSESGIAFVECIFDKALNLDGVRIDGELTIRGCTFSGYTPSDSRKPEKISISAWRAQLGHLMMSGVGTPGHIFLRSSTIRGGFRFWGDYPLPSRVHGDIDLQSVEAKSIWFEGLTISGSILASKVTVKQDVHLACSNRSPLAVDGYVEFENLSASSVRFIGVSIGKTVGIRHAKITQYVLLESQTKTDNKSEIITRIHRDRPVDLDADDTAGLSLYGSEVEQNYIALMGVEIRGDLEMTFARVGTAVFLRHDPATEPPTRITGSLQMTGLTAPRGVYIEGAQILHKVIARNIDVGELRLIPLEKKSEDKVVGVRRVEVGASLNFSNAKIAGDATILGLAAHRAPKDGDDGCSLSLRRADISGNLSLFLSPEELTDTFPTKSGFRSFVECELPNGIALSQAAICSDVKLSHVICSNGVIDLDDADVGRDVLINDFDSVERARVLSFEFDDSGERESGVIGTDSEVRPAGDLTRSYASSFLGTALKCGGDVDLTGLELAELPASDIADGDCDAPATSPCRIGSVLLQQSHIGGHVITYERVAHNGASLAADRGRQTTIPGCIDLTSAEVGQLDISSHYFKDACDGNTGAEDRVDDENKRAEVCGIVLEQARIGTLAVTRDKGEYPVPVRLKFMDVKHWDFDGASDDAEHYIEFLKNDKAIDSHSFYAVESTLLNQGEEEAADSVHVAMHNRIWENKRNSRRQKIVAPFREFWSSFKAPFDGESSRSDKSAKESSRSTDDRRSRPSDSFGVARRFIWALQLAPARLMWAIVSAPFRFVWGILEATIRFVVARISGYGTNWDRPATIVVFWWLLTGFLFSYTGNIVPSEEGLAATANPLSAEAHPKAQDWSWASGLWVAFRYHLPIVSFASLDEWEPSNNGALVIPNPRNIREPWFELPFISPEGYAYVVVALHYVLLPMVVFAASRKLIRRKEVG